MITTLDTAPSVVYFRDRQRHAAQHLIDNTPLRDTVRTFGTVSDDDGTLTVELPADAPLSSGEELLWSFLQSLTGQGGVNLGQLLYAVDADCALACAWALGIASGHFGAMTPVTFGGAL